MDLNDYPYVVKLVCDDTTYYYNSGNYMLVGDVFNATRYGNRESKSIKDDLKYVEHQGGVSSIVTYDDALAEQKIEDAKWEDEYE